MIIPPQQFGMQYLPPVGCGRSSESLLYHYSGEPANIFGDFCILLRLNGTQGDWQGSQPSWLFLPIILVYNTCQQGAWQGHPRHFPIIMVVSKRTNFIIFAIFASPWYSRWLKGLSTFLIFHGDHFGMPYLPPGGLGRSSESFFHHKGGVRAN